MSRTREIILIASAAACLFFINLGGPKLWDRDEPRNAGCAKEMLQRNDFIVPIFNDEIRDAKPVLLYWLIISAYQVFGIGEFAARFWCALLAVGTVCLTYFIGCRLFSRKVGILAAMILATSLMFDVAARAATPDSILIFFSTLALALFVRETYPANGAGNEALRNIPANFFPTRFWLIVLMYGVMALGVLAKGPIGFLMPTAIIGLYLLIVRLSGQLSPEQCNEQGIWNRFVLTLVSIRRVFGPRHFLKTCLSMRLLTAVATILLVAGPWYFLVGVKTDGDFLSTFFLKEHLGRSTTSFENHSGNIFYYPLIMCIGFFPWSVFALPVVVSLFRYRAFDSPPLVLLMCWVGVQVGVFTLVQTKLPSYVTPCYPALALLVGYHLHQWSTARLEIPDWLPKLSFAVLSLSGLTIGIAIGTVGFTGSVIPPVAAVIGIVPILTGMVAYRFWRSRQCRVHAVHSLLIGAAVLSLLFFTVILQQVSQRQEYDRLLSVATKSGSKRVLGAYGCLEPTWVFYGDRTVFELNDSLTKVDLFEREKAWRAKVRPGVVPFLTEKNGQVITLSSLIPKIESSLGRQVTVLERTNYFLKEDELVLVCDSAKQLHSQANQRFEEINPALSDQVDEVNTKQERSASKNVLPSADSRTRR